MLSLAASINTSFKLKEWRDVLKSWNSENLLVLCLSWKMRNCKISKTSPNPIGVQTLSVSSSLASSPELITRTWDPPHSTSRWFFSPWWRPVLSEKGAKRLRCHSPGVRSCWEMGWAPHRWTSWSYESSHIPPAPLPVYHDTDLGELEGEVLSFSWQRA